MYNASMIDSQTHDAVNAAYTDACAPAITACQSASAAAARSSSLVGAAAGAGLGAMACIVAADTCNAGVVQPLLTAAAARAGHSINVYDIRDACSHPPLCYDFSDLEAYMALPDVTAALGVAGRAWTECTTSVHLLLTDDWMQNLEVHIPGVLAAGVRVLVYAGNQDFICNVEGNRRWVDAMAWDGAAAFAAAPLTAWRVDGRAAGEARAARGLTFLEVNDAGHMVPMDQPAAALDMLSRFITGAPFDEGPRPLTPLTPAQNDGAQAALAARAAALWERLVGGVMARATGAPRRAAGVDTE
jgi:pimeloyl-ACP methyl ester carboxylesterase